MRRPQPAAIGATVALFVALGGTSYAVSQLPRNSVAIWIRIQIDLFPANLDFRLRRHNDDWSDKAALRRNSDVLAVVQDLAGDGLLLE